MRAGAYIYIIMQKAAEVFFALHTRKFVYAPSLLNNY